MILKCVCCLAEFCPPLADPVGGFQQCKDWGSGGQFKVCEIQCNSGLKFSQPVPKFYTCGAEGFWRPTENPALPLVYPACSGALTNILYLVLTTALIYIVHFWGNLHLYFIVPISFTILHF